MILGAEIGMIAFGLYIFARGKYQLSKTRIVEGSRARLAAFFLLLLLLLPLPIAFAVGLFLGSTGRIDTTSSDINVDLVLVEVVIIIVCLLVSVVIASTAPSETP